MLASWVTISFSKRSLYHTFCCILERFIAVIAKISGFGGLEVSVLAFGTQVSGFKPGRSRRIFRAKKPKSDVEVATFGKILGSFSPIVPPSAAGFRSRRFRRGDTWWRELERSNHRSSKLGFDVPLATELCKNHPAENTQR